MKINTINENTTDSGVTIENVLLKDDTITTTNDATINTNLNVFGNLNVTGNINAINADQIHVEDKLVILGSVASPTDVTAANGGLLLKGDTDKEFKWTSSTGWNSSEKITLHKDLSVH